MKRVKVLTLFTNRPPEEAYRWVNSYWVKTIDEKNIDKMKANSWNLDGYDTIFLVTMYNDEEFYTDSDGMLVLTSP